MAIGPVAVFEDVLLDVVESDNPVRSYDVTSKAVEDGVNISDHMHERPTTLSISGIIVGPDAEARLARIVQYQNSRRLISYTNRVIHTNMAITNISASHSGEVANGLSFRIQLKHVRRAKPRVAQITGVSPSVASKAKEGQNAGTQQMQHTSKQSNNKEADRKLKSKQTDWISGNISE